MYLMFNTIDEFDIWHAQVNTALGYANEQAKTNQYTDLLSTKNGEIICPVDNNCPDLYLSDRKIYDYENIKAYLAEK